MQQQGISKSRAARWEGVRRQLTEAEALQECVSWCWDMVQDAYDVAEDVLARRPGTSIKPRLRVFPTVDH